MLASLLLSAALVPAAPIPKDVPPTGPAPRVVDLKPGTDGKIMFAVLRQEKVKVTVAIGGAINPNGAPPAVKEVEQLVSRYVSIELADAKDLKAFNAAGKELDLKETLSKLKDGGAVVLSSDGNKLDAVYARLFKDDTIVLASPEFASIQGNGGPSTIRPGVRPLPPIKVLPPVPGGIQVLPAVPAELPVVPLEKLPAIDKVPVEKK